ncbi:Crp/Fnr family transcriptional regulator [Tardiphaga robiniae]|nr:Crp/Fnr family transcriptional regulator [Tardiphaga robiniae]
MTSLKALSDSREAYLPATAVTLRGRHACRTSPSSAGIASGRSITTAPAVRQSDLSALFMSETIDDLNDGAHFLDRLTVEERAQIRESGRQFTVRQGEAIFSQGAHHQGIFIIERGQVRVFYTAPTGREITLAYWTPGHFIGGPAISGGGTHMWSGVAIEDCDITHLSSATLQALLLRMPTFALALIDGLVAKGKCYSSMAQMLGTRSVIERLAQYILNLSELYGVADGDAVVINRKVTHDQIAAMVGSTRQWVTMMLKRFHAKRIVSIDGGVIRIHRLDQLEQILLKD